MLPAKVKDFTASGTSTFLQLDKEKGKHEHFVSYHPNGQKSKEYFQRNGIKYDTLNRWTEKGELLHREVYSDSDYIHINYYSASGQILEIGAYKMRVTNPENLAVYDSATFNRYFTFECKKPCYIRTGIWKEFDENGNLESTGEYLPMQFMFTAPTKDSSGYEIRAENTDFEMKTEISYLGLLTYLKDRTWTYYNDKGIKTKEEFYRRGLRLY